MAILDVSRKNQQLVAFGMNFGGASPYGRDGLADQSWMDDPQGVGHGFKDCQLAVGTCWNMLKHVRRCWNMLEDGGTVSI